MAKFRVEYNHYNNINRTLMETTTENTPSLIGVITETRMILRASSSKFAALSLLFLPLSYYLITTPIFVLDHIHKYSHHDHKDIIYHLLFILFVYVLALCATAMITYSVYHGKPVTFFTGHKSLNFSFFPIISTAIIAHVLQLIILLSSLVLIGSIDMLVQGLGFVIDFSSIYFMWFSAVVGVILIVDMISFHVKWSLAFVVAVIESKWGFEALTRSSYLLKGMNLVSLKLFLFYGSLMGLMVWAFSRSYGLMSHGLFYTLFHSSLLMLFLLQSTVARTVLYIHCKAFHGELTIGVSEGFVNDYISLPDDDKNVDPRVVTLVTA